MTGKIPKEPQPSSGTEEIHEHRESPSQVSNVNVNDNSPSQQQQQQPPPPKSPPPISPKPVGLSGFKLPRKQIKRSESLKTTAEMEKGKILNKINAEKKSQIIQVNASSNKNAAHRPESATTATVTTGKEASKPSAAPPQTALSKDGDPPSSTCEDTNDDAGLSPDLPGEEAPPPPDNIAFMITNTKVQALSCGEYQELVNAKKGSVQTVTVGGATNQGNAASDPTVPLDNGFSKKPVIIIFDEPMDIRSAYKRLSTVFECEEDLERMLAEERIDEESEESDTERSGCLRVKAGGTEGVDGKKVSTSPGTGGQGGLLSSSLSSIPEVNFESNGDLKQDGKKKFKFKFPKKQLAALSQAIRTGTKSGKKTLQVVVYEDEEENDGTIKQHKEAKRFEITRSKSSADNLKSTSSALPKRHKSDSLCRTDEIRKNTYKTLDSLEQTIKQLETTISEMGPPSPDEAVSSEVANGGKEKTSEGVGLKRSSSLPASKGSGLKAASKNSLQRKTKPVLLPRPVVVPTAASPAPSAPSSVQQVSL